MQAVQTLQPALSLASHPGGDWVRATEPEPLAGTLYRPDHLHAFLEAATRARKQGRRYGLALSVDRDPIGGDDTIVIHGWCTLRRLFGPGRRQSWAIGTLPRPLARAVLEGCVAPGIPVAAELVAISDRDGGLPIVSVAVLVPAAHRAVLGREPAPGRAKLRSV